MSDRIIVENNTGFFAMVVNVLGNRMVLGLLVIVLAGWRFHDWWWQEGVCEARYVHADKVGKKEVARKNAKVSKGIKSDLGLDHKSMSRRERIEQNAFQKLDWYKGKTKAIIPRDAHGAIQKVR